jgi:hypothetical protein
MTRRERSGKMHRFIVIATAMTGKHRCLPPERTGDSK